MSASAIAILDALNASGLGDLLKSAISKTKEVKISRIKATLHLVSVVVDNMDENGKCDGKTLIKELLEKKNIVDDMFDDDFGDN